MTGFSEVSHNLMIYAACAYGSTTDIGISKTVYFIIPKTWSFPTSFVAVVSGASVAGSLGFLVYFKKLKQ